MRNSTSPRFNRRHVIYAMSPWLGDSLLISLLRSRFKKLSNFELKKYTGILHSLCLSTHLNGTGGTAEIYAYVYVVGVYGHWVWVNFWNGQRPVGGWERRLTSMAGKYSQLRIFTIRIGHELRVRGSSSQLWRTGNLTTLSYGTKILK